MCNKALLAIPNWSVAAISEDGIKIIVKLIIKKLIKI
jgi:hypothetical protein